MNKNDQPIRQGFCIYFDTFFQGRVPCVSDGDDNYIVFETEWEALREMADGVQIRLQQFIDGERDYRDAITVGEYIVAVTVMPDGMLLDEYGNRFGSKVT